MWFVDMVILSQQAIRGYKVMFPGQYVTRFERGQAAAVKKEGCGSLLKPGVSLHLRRQILWVIPDRICRPPMYSGRE